MDESYRQKMIEDINELVNIPDVDTYIFLTIEQAKIKFAEEIKNYHQLKNTFHHAKRGSMVLIEDKNRLKKSQSYYFELKRVKTKSGKLKHRWTIPTIKPKPVVDSEMIIPVEFINSIDFYAIDPDKIETHKRFKSRSLKKTFDIRFTRYSDTHVMGSIRENVADPETNSESEDFQNEPGAFRLNLGQTHFREDYMELFRYMEEFPEIKEDIFNRFNLVQKPYVDNNAESSSDETG